MTCDEFNEASDFLSGRAQLTADDVDTRLEALGHLETCSKCKQLTRQKWLKRFREESPGAYRKPTRLQE